MLSRISKVPVLEVVEDEEDEEVVDEAICSGITLLDVDVEELCDGGCGGFGADAVAGL